MHSKVLAALVLLPLAALAAPAVDDPVAGAFYSPAFTACLKTAHAVRPVQECYAREIEAQTSLLQGEFERLLAGAGGARSRARLRAKQEAWEGNKDARCGVFSHRRGSLNAQKAQFCFLDEIIARRIELGALAPPRP